MENEVQPINEGAIYIVVNNIYLDCRDIHKLEYLGYAIEDNQQVNQNKKVYRIIFNDNSYMEGVVSEYAIEVFNKSKGQ